MSRFSWLLIPLLCVACSAGTTPVSSQSTPAPGASASISLAGLSFGVPSADDLRAAEAPYEIAGGESYLPFRPSVHGPISTARQLENGNYELESYFKSPFDRDDQTWGTTTVLSAHLAAPGDTPIDRYAAATLQPIVRAWAEDGVLFTTYQRLPNPFDTRSPDPSLTATEAAIIKNVGWPLAYVSATRHEALFFYATGVVLYVKWVPVHYTKANVPVSEAAAIATLVAALRDPAAMSEEARTGRDYFLGTPYVGVFPSPSVNRHDDLVPTYDIPDAIDWKGSLSNEWAAKPVWHINSTWSGGGQVDAVTGQLIRFSRMRRDAPPEAP